MSTPKFCQDGPAVPIVTSITVEEKDLVDREIVSENPVAVEYSLTKRRESLEPVIDSLEEWGKTYLRPAESEADGAW